MYNQTYEEYMRNVLGYIPSNREMEYTDGNDANMYYDMPTSYVTNSNGLSNVESLYPEIYKIVYPMVKKACNNYGREISEENVERITMEIFTNVEVDMNQEVRETTENKKVEAKSDSKLAENRNRNFLLKDLIRILVLRELIGENKTERPMFFRQKTLFPRGVETRLPFSIESIQPRIYEEENFY